MLISASKDFEDCWKEYHFHIKL